MIMASQTPRPTTAIPLAEFAADVQRRRVATDVGEMSANSGARRTESKRAFLRALDNIREKRSPQDE